MTPPVRPMHFADDAGLHVVFWTKFSDTKEAWLECGVVVKVMLKADDFAS